MTTLKSSVMHSLKWVAISKIVMQIIRWIATFWVIRLLVPEDYAIVAITGLVAGYLVAFSALGLGAPLISMKTVTMGLKRQMFMIGLIVNSLLFAIQFAIAPMIADVYDNQAIEYVLKIVGLSYLFSALTFIPSTVLVREMKFKYLSIAEIVAGTLSSIITIVLALNDAGYWSLIAGAFANEIVRGIFLACTNGLILIPNMPKKRYLPVFFYSLKMSFSEILFHAKDSVDIMMAGLYLNKNTLGAYNVGLQISSIPLRKIAPPLRNVAFPALSKINHQPEKFKEYLLKLQRLAFFITIPIFWGISSISDILVPLVLGNNWLEATPIIVVLCLAMPFKFAEEMLHPILKSLQKGTEIVVCNFIGLVIFAIAIFAGVQHGIDGLMNAWLIGLPLVYLFSAYMTCKSTGANLFNCLYQTVHPVIAGVVMLCTVEAAKLYMADAILPVVQILLCAGAGGIMYAATIYLINRPLITELKNLRS